MWVFSIYTNRERTSEYIVGVFTKEKELALAIWQHRKEIFLSLWMENVDDILNYMGNENDVNNLMPRGHVADYVPNIDYTTYRWPSLTEEMEKRKG